VDPDLAGLHGQGGDERGDGVVRDGDEQQVGRGGHVGRRQDLRAGEAAGGARTGGVGYGGGGDDPMAGAGEGRSEGGTDPACGDDPDGEPGVGPLRGCAALLIQDADPVLKEVPVIAYALIVLRRFANASPGASEW
jgi:hypothetical protein